MSHALVKKMRRAFLPAALSLGLATCSGPMVPPDDIDGATTVSSISPVRQEETASHQAPVNAVEQTQAAADVLDTSNPAEADNRNQPYPMIDEEPSVANQSIPDNGVNIDNALGVEQPVGLAEEQANEIAEGRVTQPVVDGIGTDKLTERAPERRDPSEDIAFSAADSADQITLPSKRAAVEDQTEVAFVPRFSNPEQVPEDFGGLTASDRTCRADLVKLGVKFRELEPISNGRSCGIPHPIELYGLAGGITIKPAAKVNCNITRAFAKWVKNELVPSARYRYFSGVQTIHQMSSYSCRKMNSRSNNPWSEHAHGNALDIGSFTLKSGKEIDVRKKSFFSFREKGLLKTVRNDSCKYFNTVLGPGDAYHGDHFHFDLRTRKSGYKHCSL